MNFSNPAKALSAKAAEAAHQLGTHIEAATSEAKVAVGSMQTTLAGAATSGAAIAQALKDLPRTAQELAVEMPKLARRVQTAGVRLSDTPRSEADVMALFNKIPGTSKLGVSERNIRVFLSDKHGSHIRPHARGGSNGAENIVWEVGTNNLRRGADLMTGQEQIYIRLYNAVDSVLKNSLTIGKLGVAATGTAVLTQAVVTAVAYTLDLHRGDITSEEFRDKIVAAAVSAGIATPIFFLILITVIALFPEIAVVLSAPAVITGFNALFGASIALPIVQSILRHLEASGLGNNGQAEDADNPMASETQAST
ncbi:HNH endonuclease [Phormidium tenue NIES-30]|uniref:HNH endonuclease n=2 Tax=Phormidium tenue TaxID=126344 RepID=A0A1U7IYA8_9CYAN|nr:HNH endonuclease [Phormidium tenue NIES-30]